MNKKEQQELRVYLDREFTFDGAVKFLKDHMHACLSLMGGVWVEKFDWMAFENPSEFKDFVNENPLWKADLKAFERDGYPAAVVRSQVEYDHHFVCFFPWQIGSYESLNEVMMHEIAHALTDERHLLHGTESALQFCAERIIIPWLESIYYVPTTQQLVGRREMWGGDSRRKPYLPRRV